MVRIFIVMILLAILSGFWFLYSDKAINYEPRRVKVFDGERFPSILKIGNNKILAAWGSTKLYYSISDDTGKSFDDKKIIQSSGINAGGAIYIPSKDKIILFSQSKHPPAPITMHYSLDNGNSWMSRSLKLSDRVIGSKRAYKGFSRNILSRVL